MRLFFALNIADKDKLRIHHWLERALPPFDKKVPVSNYHITLAFLGQAQPRQLEDLFAVAERMTSTKAKAPPFNETFTRPSRHARQSMLKGRMATPDMKDQVLHLTLDRFAVWTKPKIAWLGPSAWPHSLDELVRGLQKSCQQLGFASDKRAYQPHVTLARKVTMPCPYPMLEPKLDINIDSFGLYESQSTQDGVKYQCLESWPLL